MNPQKEAKDLFSQTFKRKFQKKHFCDPKFVQVLLLCGVEWISSRGVYYGR